MRGALPSPVHGVPVTTTRPPAGVAQCWVPEGSVLRDPCQGCFLGTVSRACQPGSSGSAGGRVWVQIPALPPTTFMTPWSSFMSPSLHFRIRGVGVMAVAALEGVHRVEGAGVSEVGAGRRLLSTPRSHLTPAYWWEGGVGLGSGRPGCSGSSGGAPGRVAGWGVPQAALRTGRVRGAGARRLRLPALGVFFARTCAGKSSNAEQGTLEASPEEVSEREPVSCSL